MPLMYDASARDDNSFATIGRRFAPRDRYPEFLPGYLVMVLADIEMALDSLEASDETQATQLRHLSRFRVELAAATDEIIAARLAA